MYPSSSQNLPAQSQKPSSNVKADQILWRFLRKFVSLVADARIISEADHDPQDSPTLLSSDREEAASVPTQSVNAAGTPAPPPSERILTSSKEKPARLEVDRWFSLENSAVETFKPALDIFKHISTTFPITPVETAIEPPPLIVQVLLSLPQSLPDNQVLILNYGEHQIRIENTPRYILLESWRVDITRRVPESHDAPSSTSASPSVSASDSSSFESLNLPATYKQCISLFRSLYTLLRILPAWRLHHQFREMQAGSEGGITLEMRVGVPTTSSSATSSIMDLAPTIDGSAIVDFDHALSEQHPSANGVQSMAFPSVPSPLGDLNLSLKYRVETNFTLKSSDLVLTSVEIGHFSQSRALALLDPYSNRPITDTHTSPFSPTETLPSFPNPNPNYARSSNPGVDGAAPPPRRKEGEKDPFGAKIDDFIASMSTTEADLPVEPSPGGILPTSELSNDLLAFPGATSTDTTDPNSYLQSTALPPLAGPRSMSPRSLARSLHTDTLGPYWPPWDIPFNGGKSSCEPSISFVQKVAASEGKVEDPKWVATFAPGRLEGEALQWYEELDGGTRKRWELRKPALSGMFSGSILDSQVEQTGSVGWGSSIFDPVAPLLPSPSLGEWGSHRPSSTALYGPSATSPLPPHGRLFDEQRNGPLNNGSWSGILVPQQIDLFQELASIESNWTPITKDIIDLILAIGRTIPKAIRNKHQLYRLLIRSRDLCDHLHHMLHAEGGSSVDIDIFKQCWEMVDCLERALLDLADIVSEEMVPFGESVLETWNNSCARLGRLYHELTAPPFNTCELSGSVYAEQDRYFDDCSWSSLILVAGIEVPIQSVYPSEQDIPIEAHNAIDGLNYLVNEMKLDGDIVGGSRPHH
ncbi:hypothetical protein M407DRAFT_218010 [Tulasnella calospora MUT 4182]|uniref:Autophagy-related protein 13 n=1 Tax=Tulasnella calospora MUT 4182 TaxID=1051891 RepID=A0A0C3QA33_9AGAM|nr:hypothetical protein M407DRAFT_218010 [Tulasnella calospora MUT 4182]